MSQQYPASGVLFQNDRKQNQNQPDYTGTIEVDPELVRDLHAQLESGNERPKANLAGWKKVSKNGKPFLSLRSDLLLERKNGGGYQKQSGYQNNQNNQDKLDEDEIPF